MDILGSQHRYILYFAQEQESWRTKRAEIEKPLQKFDASHFSRRMRACSRAFPAGKEKIFLLKKAEKQPFIGGAADKGGGLARDLLLIDTVCDREEEKQGQQKGGIQMSENKERKIV